MPAAERRAAGTAGLHASRFVISISVSNIVGRLLLHEWTRFRIVRFTIMIIRDIYDVRKSLRSALTTVAFCGQYAGKIVKKQTLKPVEIERHS